MPSIIITGIDGAALMSSASAGSETLRHRIAACAARKNIDVVYRTGISWISLL